MQTERPGRLHGRIALVTGASRGIGHAIATRFAEEGATVVIVSRKQPAIEAAAEAIVAETGGQVIGRVCHVGQQEHITELLSWMGSEAGPGLPDILVNNAATNPYYGPIINTPETAWDKTMEVNLKGPFSLIQAVAGALVAAKKPGSIINISSVAGLGAAPLQGVYGMSKAAMISMTQTFALELGPLGIRVNAVAPGLVETRLAAGLTENPEFAKMYTDRAAQKRYGQPSEIADIVVYLASDEASYMTGQVVRVDGGYNLF
ncbi:MAG: glucose 1-dehydrogenase [Bradymonadia bacterium]